MLNNPYNPTRRGEGEGITAVLILFVIIVAVLGMAGCPHYNVWTQEKSGQADLAKAESTRRIVVLESQAKLDSAKNLAQAEIERAKGVAEANKIIGDSLQGNELYLHYLWINNLHEGRNDVIYIPTEAGIPIMEAGRGVPKADRPPLIEKK